MAIKVTGTTVINDSRKLENFTDIPSIIKKPTVTSPAEGSTTNAGLRPIIVGTPYASVYSSDVRDYREFQVDLATGDFSSPVVNEQVNADSFTLTSTLDPDTEHKVRIRDVAVNGAVSTFSEVVSFTTANIFVDEPTVSVEGSPSDVPENPEITTSSFSVTGDTDTHASTDWEVIRTSDSVTVFESLNDTSNLTSITVTTSLDVSEEYEFRARHNGATFGASTFGSVTATTVATFFELTTLGQSCCGGFYMGTICAASTCYYLIVAPNSSGCANCQFKTSRSSTPGTGDNSDGFSNTYPALANSAHQAGNWTATRTIGGFSDWYLPAIAELQTFYNNGGGNGAGDPLPAGEDFDIGVQAYWSSTEFTADCPRNVDFDTGTQGPGFKSDCRSTRAVRREPI